MFVNIDAPTVVEGFVYTNNDGDEERVKLDYCSVSIFDSADGCVTIYRQDITKLIKALQLAEAHFVSQGE